MCGIGVHYSYRGGPVDREALLRTRDRMVSRGPDSAGAWFSGDGHVGLVHRRLSIIDLSEAGTQPMADGKRIVTFNGEIYNYRAIRQSLEAKGYVFRSQSDTEVLLHLYAEKGEAMVDDLRGMYALALWDGERRGLFLARDPYGIKPLYYSDDGCCFRAASQVKALLAGGGVDTRPEPTGHVGFFLWGHVPEPFTLYRGIRALPAGATMWVDEHGPRGPRTFAGIPQIFAEADKVRLDVPDTELRQQLREALCDTVRHHLVADVDVGVFLSAGIDSTTVAALAAEEGGRLKTVTLGFEAYRGTERDEVPLAERTAARLGAEHATIWVTRSDFEDAYDDVFDHMDQPTLDGVNTYFVSCAARRAGLKVALSGLGGDELFGGYPSFREIPRLVKGLERVPGLRRLGRPFRYVAAPILKRLTSPKYAGLLEYGRTYAGAYLLRRGLFMPWELPDVLPADLVRDGWRELQPMMRLDATERAIDSGRLKVAALESTWYMRNQLLRDTDWASMAHALEVRVPLVDLVLLRSVAPLLSAGSGVGKRMLASSTRTALPAEVVGRRKSGFSVPVREWLLAGRKPVSQERGLRGWTRLVHSTYAEAA